MATNHYTLSFGTIALDSIPLTISPAKGSTLLAADIKIEKWNGTAFVAFTDFTVPDATTSTATITPTSAFLNTDLLLVQINDGTDLSDRTMVDFKQAYTADVANYMYQLPAEAGSYKMKVVAVNGDTSLNTVESSAFNVAAIPTGGSIAIPKSYLTHFTGEVLNTAVTLTGAGSDDLEVTMRAAKQ